MQLAQYNESFNSSDCLVSVNKIDLKRQIVYSKDDQYHTHIDVSNDMYFFTQDLNQSNCKSLNNSFEFQKEKNCLGMNIWLCNLIYL